MYDCYIFDWDNTLADTISIIRRCVADTLDNFAFVGNREHIINSAGVNLSLREGFPTIFAKNWHHARDFYYRSYENRISQLQKLDGFDVVMDFIQKNNVACAINSNKRHELLIKELKLLGVEKIFKMAVGAGFMPKDKPAADGVNYIKEQLNIAKNICYVGDSNTDIICAKAAGVVSVLIERSGSRKPEDLRPICPDHTYSNLAQFIANQ